MKKQRLSLKLFQKASLIIGILLVSWRPALADPSNRITGKVTDQTGEPMIGVNVVVKGTTVGSLSDIDGRYQIEVSQGKTLVFSYVGYKSLETIVKGKIVNVMMSEDTQILEDIVVVGYGVQKKSDLTGSLSSIKSDDLAKSSAGNISQALQGKAAGVYVSSSSGSPGAGASIRIRGYSSFSSDITPLYLVDGQPLDEAQFNQISPQDIERIEILKDASACAIFGSRGANGVVLVTTKRGKEGKTSITLDASFGITNAVNRINMMDSHQLYGFLTEAYKNDGLRMPREIERLYTLDGRGLGPVDENGEPTNINLYNTDWWNESTRQGVKQNYGVSVMGGTDKLKSFFSLNHYSETGIIKTSDYSRISMRLNNEYKFNKYITIGQTLGAAFVKSHDLNMPITEILLPDPFTPVISSDADRQSSNYEYNKYMPSQYSYYGNPVAVMNRKKIEHVSRNIDGTAYANINLGLKGLDFRTMLGFELPNYDYYEFNPFFDLRPNDTAHDMCTNKESKFNQKNSAVNKSSWSLNYSFQNTLTYANTFGKHDISAMVGFTWESRSSRWMQAEKSGMPSNDKALQVLEAGTVDDYATGTWNDDFLISYLGRVNYSYGNRYLLTMNIRRDGSSKFARGNRWGTFPSFSLGWRVDQENFFKNWNQDFFSTAKVRVGWGQNGNQNITSRAFVNMVKSYETWIYAFQGGQGTLHGYASAVAGNPNIQWETSEQSNVGVDLSFFNQSLTFSGDLYLKKTRNLLFNNPVPEMVGFLNDPWTNGGEIENRGLELLVGYKGTVGAFTYGVNANFTVQKNKLVSTVDSKPTYGTVSKTEIGDPLGRFYGYVYDGLFQTPEEVQAHVGADGMTVLQPNAKPGDLRFKNLNNDNRLDDDNDQTYIGDPYPKLIYGGNINLGYKGIDLSVYIQGITGNDIWVSSRNLYRGSSQTNLLEGAFTDAWRKEGDQTDIPRISRKDDNQNFRRSSWFVENGSFCKIKTLQLGYTFPKKWMKATRFIENIRIYGSVDNLCTFTKFKFMDPEIPIKGALDLGIEETQYPNPRVFMMGVNVQF